LPRIIRYRSSAIGRRRTFLSDGEDRISSLHFHRISGWIEAINAICLNTAYGCER